MKCESTVAVIGAGIIGVMVAHALAREGRKVLLLDRGAPGMAGASFGNAGHLAAELVMPLPAPALLFGFWRQLFIFGGPLELPLRRFPVLMPWIRRFASSSLRQRENTALLAPLVKPAVRDMARALAAVRGDSLLRTNGHYELWLGRAAERRAAAQARLMDSLGIPTQRASLEWRQMLENSVPEETWHRVAASGTPRSAALWFPSTGHVLDPLELVHVFARDAADAGAEIRQAEVRALEPRPSYVTVRTTETTIDVQAAVVCAGAWSPRLLEPLGVRVPMEGVRGYHLDLPGHRALADAPILYSDLHLLVTPMVSRLRASSFMDFVDLDAAPDPRKSTRLAAHLRRLGYTPDNAGTSWSGPRPVLPDYLPGIGRIEHTHVFYAIGHQHLGLTLAPITAELVADLVGDRAPRYDVTAFDLRRFGFSR
jgi:D-hydroxyproline dehydrogenase